MSAEPSFFAAVFDSPRDTLEKELFKLLPVDFDRFIAYVLQRAGYHVKMTGPNLFRGPRFVVRSPNGSEYLGAGQRQSSEGHVVGVDIAPHTSHGMRLGDRPTEQYLFTMGEFSDDARRQSKHLINRECLLRYIRYIRGSRRDDDDTVTCLSPEYFDGRPSQLSRSKTKVLTIANNKGGVAKTTTAYYLACEWAMVGMNVLLIDLDGQANLKERCFPEDMNFYDDDFEQPQSVANYFANADKWPLDSLVQRALQNPSLRIVPADLRLSLRDPGGAGHPDMELRFMRDVHNLATRQFWDSTATNDGTPDWIIIDTPPSITMPTRVGLAAAQYMLAPVRARPASLAGTRNVLGASMTLNALTNGATRFLGTVITHWNDRQATHDATLRLGQLVSRYNGRVYNTTIPEDNQLDVLEPGTNRSLASPGGQAYHALAEEIWRDVTNQD